MKKFYFTLVTFLFLAVANAQIVNIPNAAFKAKLLAASPSNHIASTEIPNESGIISTFHTIDTNGDGEIQVSEASLIKSLSVSGATITSIVGINSFTNLYYLDCGTNPITSLNINGLTSLQILWCSSNQISSLDVSGLINLKKLFCNGSHINNLIISGLTNLEVLSCNYNPLTNLNLSGLTNLNDFRCDYTSVTNIDLSGSTNLQFLKCSHNQQLTGLNVNGLTNLESLYCYNNQLTNLSLSGLNNLKDLNCRNNQLISLDLSGLTNLEIVNCIENQLTSLDLIGLNNLKSLDCSNNLLSTLNASDLNSIYSLTCSNNQLINLNIKNNNSVWYDLHFYQNPNLTYICADEEDIGYVQDKINNYGLSATCQVNSYCSFTPGGTFYTIQGNNKIDVNNNGCDVLDSVYPNLKYNISNGSLSGDVVFDNSGNYSFPVSDGTYYITPQLENPTYFNATPTTTTVTFPATTSPFTQNFCFVPNGVHRDLEVVAIPVNVARPGFDAKYKIKYKNKGTTSENTTINFNYNDAILDLVSSSVSPTTQATGTLSWNVGTIAPFQSGEIFVTLNVNSPTETPPVIAGNILSYTATANGLNTDETPDDNAFTLSQVVVNSFDPNDKTCLEGAIINPSNIGKYVHYKIRFENTGTFAAQNIVVKDMIDTTKFDIASLQMTDASHSCITRITNPNKVEFIFENINLPFDDANNDGYVVFKIKTKPTLVVGNNISNSANIYFDYNFPIVTNTATSTFSVLQNDTFEFDNYFTIYPNPVDEVLNLTAKQTTEVYSLTIYNLLGQQVQTTTNPTNTVDVSSLKTGNYILKVVTDKGVSSSKFVKE